MAHSRTRRADGRLSYSIRAAHDSSAEASIGRRIEVLSNGCWAFNGELHRYGHVARPRVGMGKAEFIGAHRFVYETLVGPIPEGFIVHHRCENKGCCNPEHLEAMTQGDHMTLHAALRSA